jgi:hypothetical protein
MTEDPLDITNLPSDPKENILRLIGMTTSSLKEIDANITDRANNSIKGLKIDPTKILGEAFNNLQTVNLTPQESSSIVNIPVQQPPIQQQVFAAETINNVNNNENQLEFDFFRKIKPEDIEYQLKNINNSLTKLDLKIEEILKLLYSKKKTKNTS